MPRTLQIGRQLPSGETPAAIWIDLDLRNTDDNAWLEKQSDLPAHLVEHLQQRVDFSRREIIDGGLLICFHNRMEFPGQRKQADQSIRLWIEKDRVITVRADSSAECDALYEAVREKPDAWSPLQIVSFLVRKNSKRLEAVISEIVGQVGNLEDQFVDDEDELTSKLLSSVGQKMMRTRRHLIEQRDLLKFCLVDESLPINEPERRALGSAQNHVQSYLEGLDDCQGRLILVRDQIDARRADRFNRNALQMTILATVFLPLSFLTGLLGMNVAGIPDEHNPWGFATACGVMIVIAIIFWLFLTRRWT